MSEIGCDPQCCIADDAFSEFLTETGGKAISTLFLCTLMETG